MNETVSQPSMVERVKSVCGQIGVMGTRKFVLTAGASIVSCAALFTGKATMDQWIMAQSVFLGMYGVANITDKRLNAGKGG